jgi:hypothetical protein
MGMALTFMALFLATALGATPAIACRGPFPAPISQSEAFDRAEAVFLGEVAAISQELPEDFTPTNAATFEQRHLEAKRQNIGSLGHTITFNITQQWKGVPAATIKFVDLAPTNSCEWWSPAQVGDRMIVFAARNGNYLTLPSLGFDGRSAYTIIDPSSYSEARRRAYPEAVAAETERYQKLLKSLN